MIILAFSVSVSVRRRASLARKARKKFIINLPKGMNIWMMMPPVGCHAGDCFFFCGGDVGESWDTHDFFLPSACVLYIKATKSPLYSRRCHLILQEIHLSVALTTESYQ